MKNIVLVFALLSVVVLSCDGRQTKKEALKRAVSEYNSKTSQSQMVSYHPEAYVEIVTDTLIANTVNVRIKNYSLMDQQILISNVSTTNTKTINYQRVFESEIHISTVTKDILTTHISAQQFKVLDADPFWKNATLQHTWVNQELSSLQNIILDISFINPNTAASKLYRMSINVHGQQTLNLIEEHS
ncbi:hypothetical protein [Gelidibacter salicanalis]|uniref:DUF4738 domain-containing protein n=1 Tax=Gelidibacter salicanalis TaxID=291193 RepID=A0A934NEU8_9FLAO|nr:hypothetical protein [Gelidibacter salicanalis]MBJ7883065.1 hypothetical protein [Gelidibacter salicanalis]